MELIEITWMRAIRIFWAWVWRGSLIAFPVIFAGGVLSGFGFLSSAGFGIAVNIIPQVIALAAYIIALKVWVLGKEFGDFKLMLVREEPN